MTNPYDYSPWIGAFNTNRLEKIYLSDLENACHIIIKCIRTYMHRHPTDWREFRDFFHKDVGCWSIYKDCPGER